MRERTLQDLLQPLPRIEGRTADTRKTNTLVL